MCVRLGCVTCDLLNRCGTRVVVVVVAVVVAAVVVVVVVVVVVIVVKVFACITFSIAFYNDV